MFVQEEIQFMYLKDKNPIKVLSFCFSTSVSNIMKSLIFFPSLTVIVVIIIFVLYLLNCNWVLDSDLILLKKH